jgi:aminoglycoside phosphotransferase (APT) family kinase protein
LSATQDKQQSDPISGGARLADWAERTIGGRVVSMEAVARWRPAWNFDVDTGDRILALHARGERDDGIGMPYQIDYERRVHDLLEAHDVPVPHVYGYCDDPYVMVMDRLSGSVDLSFAASDQERVDVVHEYLSFLPRIYGIDLEEAKAVGFTIPESREEIGLGLLPAFESGYDERMVAPDPVSEFLRVWLHRHYPRHRSTRRVITFDAFQFMFEKGRITGLIDFELAHVGDPLSELAVLPVRDTIKNLGDLSAIAMTWSDITGEELDYDVLDFHGIAYNAHAVLSAAPLIVAPPANGELMSYFGWYVNGARWAFERIAELGGFELGAVDPPVARPSRHSPGFSLLVHRLSNRGPAIGVGDREKALSFRVARYLQRVDEIGRAVEEDDLNDAADLLGHRPGPEELDAALVSFIRTSTPDDEEDLARLLDRRVQRLHLTLAPEGSMMLRHPRLKSLRPGSHGGPGSAVADDLPWTPGLIAGTR